MANTLKECYINKRNMIKALESNAKSSLSNATNNLGKAKKEYDKLVVEYASLEKDMKKKREALNTALMPSDIESLAEELRQLTLQLRKKRSEILAAEQRLSALQLNKGLAEAQLKRAGSALTAAEAQIKAAETREDQHTAWNQTVADGSLAALANQAQALLEEVAEGRNGGNGDAGDGGNGNGGNGDAGDGGNGNGGNGGNGDAGDGGNGNGGNGDGEAGDGESAEEDNEANSDNPEKSPIQKAKTRIESDISVALLVRARERGQRIQAYLSAQNELLEDIENELDTHRESTEGASGLSAKRWREYQRAEEAFKDFVLQSTSRYDQALSLIQTVNASAKLTKAQKSRIEDPALAVVDDALAKEKALGVARTAVITKEAEISLAIAKAIIKDIDADPEADATVQAKRGELETLNTALATAESAYTEVGNKLDLWEAAIPDHIWANLIAYDNAKTLLTAIKDGDPSALATTMNNAEKSLVSALEKVDQNARVNESVNDRLIHLNGQLESLRNTHHQRKLSAVRGDA